MIGEQFDHGDEVCGAVVNVRGKQEKIGLWTKNALNEAAQVISMKTPNFVMLPVSPVIYFWTHKNTFFSKSQEDSQLTFLVCMSY